MAETALVDTRAEWLQKRRTGISGTDIAGILGLSPWTTPVGVYLDKVGLSQSSPETPVQKRGKRMESTVASIYEEETGFQLIDPGFLRHNTLDWVIGTPDRLAGTPDSLTLQELPSSNLWLTHGLEIKTAHWSQKDKWGEEGTDEVPIHYLLQCAWYMAVTELPFFDLWAMFSLDDIRQFRIHRDLEFETSLIDRAYKFWTGNVLAQKMPEIDGSDKATAYIISKFPKNLEPMQEAPEGALELARKAVAAQERKKQAEYEEGEYKNRLKDLIGEAEGFLFGPDGSLGKVTWKKEKDSVGTDWEAVAKRLHELIIQTTRDWNPGMLPLAESMLDELVKKCQKVTRQGARKLLLNLKEISA